MPKLLRVVLETQYAQKSVYDVRRIDTAVFRLYGYPFRDIESLFDRFGKIVISVYHASLSALIRQIKNKISFAAANGSFTVAQFTPTKHCSRRARFNYITKTSLRKEVLKKTVKKFDRFCNLDFILFRQPVFWRPL